MNTVQPPIIEAYVGEYASGKSENAINRALELVALGRKVSLIDLDMVEPFYTLRPIKQKLIQEGIEVVAWETHETIGLGEAGYPFRPEMRWALKRQGDIILDVGYGVMGAKTLNLLEGYATNLYLKIYVVINLSRPVTANKKDIIDYVSTLEKVDGLINNTHLGDETTVEVVQEGARTVTAVAQELVIPVMATVVAEKLAGEIGKVDCMGNPVRVLRRFMPGAFW